MKFKTARIHFLSDVIAAPFFNAPFNKSHGHHGRSPFRQRRGRGERSEERGCHPTAVFFPCFLFFAFPPPPPPPLLSEPLKQVSLYGVKYDPKICRKYQIKVNKTYSAVSCCCRSFVIICSNSPSIKYNTQDRRRHEMTSQSRAHRSYSNTTFSTKFDLQRNAK